MRGGRTRKRRVRGATPRSIVVRQVVVGLLVIACLALIGAGIWYGSRISAFTITTVSVVGGETVSHEAVRARVERELSGSYFKLVPHRFAWLYPKERIEAAVREIERIHEVDIVERSGKEIEIIFTEYRPAMLWCASVVAETCVFVDVSGYAFEEAPRLSGNAFLRYSDQNRVPALGEQVFSAEKSAELLFFRSGLRASRGFVLIHVEQSTQDEMILHLQNGGRVKVSERIPARETLANLETVLASEEFAHLVSGNFDYIDLRYGDRVFVNEFGTETEDTTPTAASDTENEETRE